MNKIVLYGFTKNAGLATEVGKSTLNFITKHPIISALIGGSVMYGGARIAAETVRGVEPLLTLNAEYGKKKQLKRQADTAEKMYNHNVAANPVNTEEAIPPHLRRIEGPLI